MFCGVSDERVWTILGARLTSGSLEKFLNTLLGPRRLTTEKVGKKVDACVIGGRAVMNGLWWRSGG